MKRQWKNGRLYWGGIEVILQKQGAYVHLGTLEQSPTTGVYWRELALDRISGFPGLLAEEGYDFDPTDKTFTLTFTGRRGFVDIQVLDDPDLMTAGDFLHILQTGYNLLTPSEQ